MLRYDTASELAEIERCHLDRIEQLEVEGWNIWPLYRLAVSNHLSDPGWGRQERLSFGRRLRLLAKGVWLALGSLAQLAWLAVSGAGRGKVVVRTFTYSRRDEIDGKRFCVFFDQMVTDLGRTNFVVSESRGFPEHDYERAVPNPVAFHDDVVPLLASVIRRLTRGRARRTVRRLAPAAKAISSAASAELEPLVADFLARYPVWRFVYGLVRPRAALVSVAYCGRTVEVAALRSLGIPVFEVEHGQMTPEDTAYAYSAAVKHLRHAMALPDKLLVVSEDQRAMLQERGFWGPEDLPVIGSARLSTFLRQAAAPRCFAADVHNVLVCPNCLPPIPHDLRNFIESYLARRPDSRCVFRVKPHPSEDAGPWRELAARHAGRVEVVDGNLYRLLSTADAQLAVYTTCLQEGLYWGVPAYVLRSMPYAAFESRLVARGAARFIEPDYAGDFERFDVPAGERGRYLCPLALDVLRSLLWSPS